MLLAAAACGTACATACAFWDLGGYSSGADAGVDAGVDAPVVDAATDAQPDAAACLASFTVPFPGLWIHAALDPAREVAYVAAGHDVPDGGLAGTGAGYFAVVDACAGNVTKAFDPPLANGKATWALSYPALSGTSVYLTAGFNPPFAGYARFDTVTQAFTQTPLSKPSAYVDELWSLTATAAGGVWLSGTRAVDQSPGVWTGKGDVTGQPCSYFPLQGPENHGRAITSSGNDVYQAIADASLRVLHFDDAACAAKAPCGACLSTWASPSFVAPGSSGAHSAYALRTVGTKLYMGGFAVVTGNDFLGFVAELDLATHKWGPVFTFNPSNAIDAFISLAVSPDGKQLFAGAVKGWDGSATFTSATGELFTLPIPFAAVPQATSINLPVVAPWSVDADARGVYVAGTTDQGNGLFLKCQSSTQCPSN